MDDTGAPSVGVVRSIEAFVDDVTRYLLPVVRFVGHKNELFDLLARTYPGLIHEREHSGASADLVVFDHLPVELVVGGQLSAEPAYIFRVDEERDLAPSLADRLARHTAVTLLAPSNETSLWHTTALLLIKELSYASGAAVFVELLSVDGDHRRALAQLVGAVLDARSCVVSVPSDAYRAVLLDFLFGTMPDVIAPTYVDPSRLMPNMLVADRFNVVCGRFTDSELSGMVLAAEAASRGCPLLILDTRDVHHASGTIGRALHVSLGGWRGRRTDAHLLAYWAAAWRSHRTGTVPFFSASAIERIHSRSGDDPCVARRLFTDAVPRETTPDAVLVDLLGIYQRLSLNSILDEAERQIMLRLRERSPLVEAASHAAGLPTVTFHKRSRRLAERSSLIKLLASARSS